MGWQEGRGKERAALTTPCLCFFSSSFRAAFLMLCSPASRSRKSTTRSLSATNATSASPDFVSSARSFCCADRSESTAEGPPGTPFPCSPLGRVRRASSAIIWRRGGCN